MYSLIWHEVVIGLNDVFWPQFIFIKPRKYLAAYFTTEDFRIWFRSPPANYGYGCHVAPVTHGAIGYVSYQKGIIQGHPGYWCRTIEALGLCSKIVFQPIISLDVSTQTVFLYYMTVTYNLSEYFWWFLMSMLRNGCYAKQTKSKYFQQFTD